MDSFSAHIPRKDLTRRSLLEHGGMVATALVAMPVHILLAADLPHLSTDDPVAAALGYTPDATKVDRSRSPTYRPGQHCANCLQNSGAPGQSWGACKLFTGKLVNENGWCRAYVAKV